jgi:hypothetical protein
VSGVFVRVGVGTRFRYDGETVEVIEMAITATGNEVVLKDHHGRLLRLAVRELLLSDRARVIPDSAGPSSDDVEDLASVVLAQLSHGQRDALLETAAHIREVLTGYRSGSPETAEEGEPRPQYAPDRPLYGRYADKAAELGVGHRTIQRWVQGFQRRGGAGLVGADQLARRRGIKVDDRWTETALEMMAGYKGEVATAALARRAQERPWLKDPKSQASSAMLREYTRVEFDLRGAYLKKHSAGQVDWAPWGGALSGLSPICQRRRDQRGTAASGACR